MRFDRPAFLMCEPRHFGIAYEINPWMRGNAGRTDQAAALAQWNGLREALSAAGADIRLAEPAEGQPDMAFAANAALVYRGAAIPARFAHERRRGDEKPFAESLAAQGFELIDLPEGLVHEGSCDAIFDRSLPILWGAYGQRTDLDAQEFAGEAFGVEPVALRLIDERFYHLCTCFAPLEGGFLLYYPGAFDETARRTIAELVPAEKLVTVDDADASALACDALNLGQDIFVHEGISDSLRARLADLGFAVRPLPLPQFMMAGGGARDLALRLDETPAASKLPGAGVPRPEDRAPVQPVVSGQAIAKKRVSLQGHLIDSGILSRFVEFVRDVGGSWEIESFELGKGHHDQSAALVALSAPSQAQMESILARAIEMGAALAPAGEKAEAKIDAEIAAEPAVETAAKAVAEAAAAAPPDARLEQVEMDGVAPGDFAITTIYPTEIRVEGQWVRVANQRMDGMIVVEGGETPSATCRIMRDLKKGEMVVVGVEGTRVIQPKREAGGDEFGFMGAGVSSERRVEVAVEQIAWDLERIRERGGRAVVVAGPVVVHTGGGPYLAELIREGYVSALLGGNAIAVHDMEQAMLGTSLGVDLNRGVAVAGGHKHHIRTINLTRRLGGIRQTVEAGLLKSGIMCECVRRGVPFSLAGSIRDDGPLLETKMDLVAAQEEYQEMIRGAEMILMLSSMLHSIGVGNMTPAGVKLICVDINPAVVTKLADRGSAESVGVVTDVGLFLRLLADKLRENRRRGGYSGSGGA